MINIEDVNDNRVVTIRASGKLTAADYDTTIPQLEQLLKEHDKLRFFIKLEDFSGMELEALKKDLKFDKEHMDQFGKTAIVGDKKWEEWGTKISDLFFSPEMKYFDQHDSDEAWKWIND